MAGKKAQVKLDLKNLSYAQLIALTRKIVRAMTDNTNFPAPVPPLADLTGDADALQANMDEGDALDRSRKQVTIQGVTLSDALREKLSREGDYVDLVAQGREDVIVSADMEVRSDNHKPILITTPQNFDVTLGDNSGELDPHWDAVKGARIYILEICHGPSPEGEWKPLMNVTASKAVVKGLKSGEQVWLRVSAQGSGDTPSAPSNPVSRFVP